MIARRGRPPAYDREAALMAIAEAFRLRGYAAASLDEIARAAGMNRPSLFAAFGNKKAMYLAALEDYRRRMERAVSPALEREGPLGDALTGFFDAAVGLYGEGAAPGCLVLCTATAEAPADEEIAAVLADTIRGIEAQLTARIAREAADGEVAGLAHLMVSVLIGIAVQARAGVDETALKRFARVGVAAALRQAL
ncbi:TetR/AcrR family transcriptional regulator [Nitratireductor aquimarinus]|uniref:TetR/AcrR family transcriptional regulator n=1 Tax=Nitratireductor aquimarinus TaxID=889300 RepID=UPI0029356F3D|nr:TetR/AcrR family transcriptional regulator [Nitratireductor aquimarinus]MDV2966627.1 TetR/AcrR family transcriptional regulator [Nitratireductor aquimarinus]